ncbi:hypothetical protein ABT324_27095, partial [Saccharopolyspora sp. NPDC000359]|uniref:hypothetical protein n=1 Tax=Saccharopolyspora sp. NPDC000359 TaxID=3154251 RepID=UPI0033221D31
MEFEQVARELCTADPAGFTPARDREAAAAKERGDHDLAAALKKLRKPTTAAWAVNLLAAHAPDALDTLLDLGERLRSAQRELRGDDLRSLARERTSTLRDLTGQAAALAEEHGHPLTEATRQQVEQTLTAALSDPEAARQVQSATLAKPLEYSGFGLDEVAAAAIRRTAEKAEPAAAGRSEEGGRPGKEAGRAGTAAGRSTKTGRPVKKAGRQEESEPEKAGQEKAGRSGRTGRFGTKSERSAVKSERPAAKAKRSAGTAERSAGTAEPAAGKPGRPARKPEAAAVRGGRPAKKSEQPAKRSETSAKGSTPAAKEAGASGKKAEARRTRLRAELRSSDEQLDEAADALEAAERAEREAEERCEELRDEIDALRE